MSGYILKRENLIKIGGMHRIRRRTMARPNKPTQREMDEITDAYQIIGVVIWAQRKKEFFGNS